MAYWAGAGAPTSQRIQWFDRKGNPLGPVGPPGDYGDINISPDGRALAANMKTGSYKDIWVIDLVRGTNSRLTFGGAGHGSPQWSPDGRQVAFSVFDGQREVIHRMPATGIGKEEFVAKLDRNAEVDQWTSDGQFLILRNVGFGKPAEIWAAPLADGAKPFPVVTGPFTAVNGNVSPDGKWITYQSSETGRAETYVQDFPPKGGKWQISANGGELSTWFDGGRQLIYRNYVSGMTEVVDVKIEGGKLVLGIPKPLFHSPGGSWTYSPDGQNFYFLVADDVPNTPTASRPFTVVTNWTVKLKK